jgi:hypothetical protein
MEMILEWHGAVPWDAVLALLEATLTVFKEKKEMILQISRSFRRVAGILQLAIALRFQTHCGHAQIFTLIKLSQRIYALAKILHVAQNN